MKIDYNTGGVYCIKHVMWDAGGQMYLDITILIPEVACLEDLALLRQLHQRSLDPDFASHQVVMLKDIRHLLNGVGRIIQYFNPLPV